MRRKAAIEQLYYLLSISLMVSSAWLPVMDSMWDLIRNHPGNPSILEKHSVRDGR